MIFTKIKSFFGKILLSRNSRFLPLFLLLPLAGGCDIGESSVKVEKIEIIQGDNQCVIPEEICGKELIIEVLGPVKKGFLGGKGERIPLKDVLMRFEALDGSDLTVLPEEKIYSGPGGRISVRVKAGKKTGDHYLKIRPDCDEKISQTIRIICGVSIKGAKQEANVGEKLAKPVQIFVCDGEKKPLKDVPVYFTMASQPDKKSGAECRPERALTNADGYAETQVKIGKNIGKYVINAEVAAPSQNINIRGIKIEELGLDSIALFLVVAGGLAIFIFGMTIMSDGLQLVAGNKMKQVLCFFASNRFVAVIAGTMVTGIIQSSSACTVMVVGFINAGLLTLRQAIGIIFGSNIGTTMTAQMISFKLEVLALPAIIIGVLIVLLARKNVWKGWGQTILGFGLLFYGMMLMGDELKRIADFPTFVNFFKAFDCTPIDGSMPFLSVLGAIGVGTAMTLIIQSSSATIGIALALASSGLINFWTAFPLILGDNIGTTITAVLASLGANRTAKQAALAHVLFNVIGTVCMVVLLYVKFPGTGIPVFLYFVNAITEGDVFAPSPQNIARHIAMSHTMFNVANVIIFLPFIAGFEKICRAVIPTPQEEKIQHLEPHLLDTPSIAIEQVISSIRYMLKESWEMTTTAMTSLFLPGKFDEKIAGNLAEREKKIDVLQEDITEYLVKLTSKILTEDQAEIIPFLMHSTNDAEKIADHTENIITFAKRISEAKNKLPEEAQEELSKLWQILDDQAKHLMQYLDNTDKEDVKIALNDETEINRLMLEFEQNHISRLKKGKCKPKAGVIYIEMLGELEKIGDNLTNIAERAPEIQKHHLKLLK